MTCHFGFLDKGTNGHFQHNDGNKADINNLKLHIHIEALIIECMKCITYLF